MTPDLQLHIRDLHPILEYVYPLSNSTILISIFMLTNFVNLYSLPRHGLF